MAALLVACAPTAEELDPHTSLGMNLGTTGELTLSIGGTITHARQASVLFVRVGSSEDCAEATRVLLADGSAGGVQPASGLLLPSPLVTGAVATTSAGDREVNAFTWTTPDAWHRFEFDVTEVTAFEGRTLELALRGTRLCSGASYLDVVDLRHAGPCPPAGDGVLRITLASDDVETRCAEPSWPSDRTGPDRRALCVAVESHDCSVEP